MNAAAETAAPLDALLALLLHRPPAERLEAIARLAQSRQAADAAAEKSAASSILDFAGAWAAMPGTDEELVAAGRQARQFTRPETSLD